MTKMPKKGWKSITVKEDVYDYFKKEYDKRKVENKLEDGITSFTGFINHRLYQMLQQEKKRTPQ